MGRSGTQQVHPFTEPHQAQLPCTKTRIAINTNTHQIQEEEGAEVSSCRQAGHQHHITAKWRTRCTQTQKRTEGIQGKQENQERDFTTTDHRVARREQPRSLYTVYVSRHSKHRTVV